MFAIAALIGAGGGVFFLALAKHDLDAQAAYRSAAACSAPEALGGRNCLAATSGTVNRKYTEGAFPAADLTLPATGRVVKATFPNSHSGKSAWSKLPTGSVLPVSLWRGLVIQVNGVATIDHPDQPQNTGVAPWGVLMIIASLGIGAFAIHAILLERKRYLSLRPK